MTDIIQDAKQLLDAATRGPWVVYTRSFGVIDAIGPIERDLTEGLDVDSGSAELAAAAPELAEALAEETYEYGVEYKYLTNRGAEWRLDPDVGWHKTYRDAERAARASVRCRIVRRRVSPVEVINE